MRLFKINLRDAAWRINHFVGSLSQSSEWKLNDVFEGFLAFFFQWLLQHYIRIQLWMHHVPTCLTIKTTWEQKRFSITKPMKMVAVVAVCWAQGKQLVLLQVVKTSTRPLSESLKLLRHVVYTHKQTKTARYSQQNQVNDVAWRNSE